VRVSSPSTPRPYLLAAIGALAALVLLVGGCGTLNAYKSPDVGRVGICQSSGPFDDRGTCGILPPGSGKKFLGTFNDLRQFPATQRNYLITADPSRGDKGGVDVVQLPTSDGVKVGIEGQALFTLNLDSGPLLAFYRRYGTRTFNGLHPYDGDEGWSAFLDIQFRPVLDNALRQEILKYDCAELNPGCKLIKGGATTGEEANRNLATIQQNIARTLQDDLASTLGGPYLVNVRFSLTGISLPGIQANIDRANAAKADVATARFEANKRVEQAIGDRRVAEQKARAIAATRNAYRTNPAQARIDAIRALPQHLQSLGGNTAQLLGSSK
jgi:regulator of protease activity HflC (stomatin/prohibitin superfamily)